MSGISLARIKEQRNMKLSGGPSVSDVGKYDEVVSYVTHK